MTEADTAYTTLLAFHGIGLALVVGISVGIALRVRGVASRNDVLALSTRTARPSILEAEGLAGTSGNE